MIVRNDSQSNRRGLSTVECAIVYPVTMLLLLGSLILGLGVFRYQQLQSLAREGARYASVHGHNYASATGNSIASTSTVATYVQGMAVSLTGLSCTSVSYTSTTSIPSAVTVTLSYTWKPEGYFSQVTWTATSTEIVTY
jgi:Flp pilus assembly protein TadG